MHHVGFCYRFILLHGSSLLDVMHVSYVYKKLGFALFSRLVL